MEIPSRHGHCDEWELRDLLRVVQVAGDPTLIWSTVWAAVHQLSRGLVRCLWPELRVVRFDNSDAGLSSMFEEAPIAADGTTYNLSDMAADANRRARRLGCRASARDGPCRWEG